MIGSKRAQYLGLSVMYGGGDPVRRLIQPPFQVESHLYQPVQVADWIASIVGPLWSHRALPVQYADEQWAEKYFAARIEGAAVNSTVKLRR